eukprot:3673985-Pleurochrysis_carterae.AAC.1
MRLFFFESSRSRALQCCLGWPMHVRCPSACGCPQLLLLALPWFNAARRGWPHGWNDNLLETGRACGAAFAKWHWWPFTLHAARLMVYADRCGRCSELKQELFKLCYEEGARNIIRTWPFLVV